VADVGRSQDDIAHSERCPQDVQDYHIGSPAISVKSGTHFLTSTNEMLPTLHSCI